MEDIARIMGTVFIVFQAATDKAEYVATATTNMGSSDSSAMISSFLIHGVDNNMFELLVAEVHEIRIRLRHTYLFTE